MVNVSRHIQPQTALEVWVAALHENPFGVMVHTADVLTQVDLRKLIICVSENDTNSCLDNVPICCC